MMYPVNASSKAKSFTSAISRAALVLTLAMAFSTLGIHSSQAMNRGPCDSPRFMHLAPGDWSPARVKGLIRCSVKRFGPIDGGAAKAIATFTCESSLYPGAVGGDNLGVAQHKAAYWLSRVNTYLKPEWFSKWRWSRIHQEASVSHPQPAFDGRSNVIVAIRMVHRYGWSPWSCA